MAEHGNLAADVGVLVVRRPVQLEEIVVRPLSPVLGATLLALALTGCSQGTSSTVEAASAPAPAPSPSPSPSVVPSPETVPSVPITLEPSLVPSPSASPVASPSVAAVKKASYDVTAVQRTLTDLKYYAGPVDGRSGPAVKSAVMAFQKVNGLPADGGVGPATLAGLASPKEPALRGGPANRVEVDLTRQVLYVVKGGALVRIMPVSSGNGATYAQKDGSKARALTPTGHYTIERRIVGERKADLGILYDPQYFYRGWAIHGTNSVPAGPASRGCVRVTRQDAKYLLTLLSNGMAVHLYGGTHVFEAGSGAPGTDSPTGDGGAAAPAPAPEAPAPKPAAPKPQPAPAADPAPPAAPSPEPTATSSATPTG